MLGKRRVPPGGGGGGRPAKKTKAHHSNVASKTQCIGLTVQRKRCTRKKNTGGAPYLCFQHKDDLLPAPTSRPPNDKEIDKGDEIHFDAQNKAPTYVPWILPQTRSKQQRQVIFRKYFPILFERNLEEGDVPLETQLQRAPIYSPLINSQSGRASRVDRAEQAQLAHQKNQSSKSLKTFCQGIQKRVETDVAAGRARDFFEAVNDDTEALVAFYDCALAHAVYSPLVADIIVKASSHELESTATIFLRRSLDRTGNAAFFISIPTSESVVVNGDTFTNPDDSAHHLFIGPLEGFTVIELLGVPLLFWRTRSDLGHVRGTGQSKRANRPSNATPELHDGRLQLLEIAGDGDEDAPVESDDEGNARDHEANSYHCEYFNFVLEKLEAQEGVAEWLSQESRRRKRSESNKDYLPEYELLTVLSSINSVAEAITMIQGGDQGFSIVRPGDVRWMHDPVNEEEPVKPIRPGRPLLLPWMTENHMVLLLAQYDISEETISVSVFDSAPWLSKREDRANITIPLEQLLLKTHWNFRGFEVPDAALFAWSAEQRFEDDRASPIHTTLHAWAHMLGQSINTGFIPTDNFYSQARTLSDLARGGFADYKLIYAFLRCHKFVKGESIPSSNRRFLNTIHQEEQHRVNFSTLTRPQSVSNDYTPSIKMGHSDPFPSDSWDKRDRIRAEHLQKLGFRVTDLPSWKLRRKYRDSISASVTSEPHAPGPSAHFPSSNVRHVPDAAPDTGSQNHTKIPRQDAPPTERSTEEPSPSRSKSNGTHRKKSTEDSGSQKAPGARRDTFRSLFGLLPCTYLQRNQVELLRREQVKRWYDQTFHDRLRKDREEEQLALTDAEIVRSITEIQRAINELQDDEQGFAIIDSESLIAFGTSGDVDDGLVIRPGRPLLFPLTRRTHTLLILVQATLDGTILHAIDSSRITLGKTDREEILETIKELLQRTRWNVGSNAPRPESVRWLSGAQQSEEWQAGYYTILNAWSVLLGFRANPNFSPSKPGFFQMAAVLVRLTLGQFTDWKLLWAFLLCHGFIMDERAPVHDRRFTQDKILPEKQSQTDHQRQSRNGKRNGVDLSNFTDFVPDPKRSVLVTPQGIKSCTYLRQNLETLLLEEAPKKWLSYIRDETKDGVALVTSDVMKPLDDEETLLAIASVTLAVTRLQDVNEGLSIISSTEVRASDPGIRGQGIVTVKEAIRFGRPMLVSMMYKHHAFLVVIQLDQKHLPTISVLDPKVWHFDKADRLAVHKMAMDMLRRSRWWRNIWSRWEDVPIPSNSIWVPCAQHHEDHLAGYYVILNAWALALGLKLNVDFNPDLASNFLDDLLDIVHLARIGHCDWRLIFAFLQCYQFTTSERHVPDSRRFTNTVRLFKEVPDLDDHLEKIRNTETSPESLDYSWNISFPQGGRRHTSVFPSDDWTEETILCVPELVEWKKLNVNHDDTGIAQDFDNSLYDEFETADAYLEDLDSTFRQETGADPSEFGGDAVLLDLVSQPRNWKVVPKHVQALRLAQSLRPCNYSNHMWKKLSAIDKHFSDSPILRNVPLPTKFEEFLEDETVAAAIASVLEPLDHLQPLNSGQHTGGFSIAASTFISSGRQISDDHVTRPRRCWLMPFTVDQEFAEDVRNERRKHFSVETQQEHEDSYKKMFEKSFKNRTGHVLLAVLQEEFSEIPTSESTSEFVVYFLDSAPKYYDDVRDFFYGTIQQIARNLGWTKHRNDDRRVQFSTTCREVFVARQINGWACGYHTIVNAWILALGLRPNPDAEFENPTYKGLHLLIRIALLGQLDWLTLAAFLICSKLVVETSTSDVPLDRRFQNSRFQGGDFELGNRLEELRFADAALLTLPEDDFPYNHGTNVPFESSESPDGSEDEDEEQYEDIEGEIDDVEESGEEEEDRDGDDKVETEEEDEKQDTPLRPQMSLDLQMIARIAREYRKRGGLQRAYEDLGDWFDQERDSSDGVLFKENALDFLDNF
ncbi:hypothetical protein K491DRAFT_675845 [Lophiostoma macrostomum CBS 122681]|uniref:Ubiquitin-like protease family profile domain-containing protein n=1 Tax=Lophiostoma macrostomum CBS 122681 TaxID=1314788 RepID=A0A6A6TJP6_9PLEO|nr:hypothetical protein K491DRAFT_675845 [Lophiostoma macrostomum CBS 122681]